MTSPSGRGGPPAVPAAVTSPAGKASTLVGLSIRRQSRLSTRTLVSSARATLSSARIPAAWRATTAFTARRTSAGETPAVRQRGSSSETWIWRAVVMGRGLPNATKLMASPAGRNVPKSKIVLKCSNSTLRYRPPRHARSGPGLAGGTVVEPIVQRVVGSHDARDHRMPDDVGVREGDDGRALDPGQGLERIPQPRARAQRQVDLREIAGDRHAAVLAHARQEHLHLARRGVLRLVQDDECVGQG